ncbi:MAG: hypothetical protein HFJ30_00675 [Clostridia bacterium]|jgi:hypothetical protein|nr:hypothetical protein [Clostridia bacterium]
MFSQFPIGKKVLVTGIGKNKGTKYLNNIGIVICRDPYYHDYNIQFEDTSEDWLNVNCLKNYEGG